ncbi:hypothetical protein B0H11DRAFT_2220280 [Mycena galericulata]|nr:hypothetical protein B0H11DRAFT_2220280 [Mycena galericulata]
MVLNHCNPLIACWIKCTGSSLQRDSCLVYFSQNPFDTFQLTGPVLVSGVDVELEDDTSVFIANRGSSARFHLSYIPCQWTLASCAAGNSVLASSRPIVLQVVEKRILAVWTNGNDDVRSLDTIVSRGDFLQLGEALVRSTTRQQGHRSIQKHQRTSTTPCVVGLLLGDTTIDTEPLRFPSASDVSPPRPSSGPCSPPSVGATENTAELVLLVHDGLSVRYRFAGRRNERHVSWSTGRTVAARPAQGTQMWAIVVGASQARSSSCCDRDLEDPLDEVLSYDSQLFMLKDENRRRLDYQSRASHPPPVYSSCAVYLSFNVTLSPLSSSATARLSSAFLESKRRPGCFVVRQLCAWAIYPHISISSVQGLAVPSIRPSPGNAAASRAREVASLPLTAMTAASRSNNTGGRYRKRLPERPKPEPVMLDAAAARRSYVESLALRRPVATHPRRPGGEQMAMDRLRRYAEWGHGMDGAEEWHDSSQRGAQPRAGTSKSTSRAKQDAAGLDGERERGCGEGKCGLRARRTRGIKAGGVAGVLRWQRMDASP